MTWSLHKSTISGYMSLVGGLDFYSIYWRGYQAAQSQNLNRAKQKRKEVDSLLSLYFREFTCVKARSPVYLEMQAPLMLMGSFYLSK